MTNVSRVWRGLLALLAATMAVTASQVLRADSDGPTPGATVSVAAAALLTLAFLPLTRRRRRLPLLFGALLGVQLGGHALLSLATTGRFGTGGAVGLVCCLPAPAADQVGVLSGLTAQAGWLLLAVQLVTALVLALSLQAAQGVAVELAGAVSSLLRLVVPAFAAALGLLLAALPGLAPVRRVSRPAEPPVRTGRYVEGAVRRRGPPVRTVLSDLSFSPPRVAVAL